MKVGNNVLVACLALSVQAGQTPQLCERWQQAYAGDDATNKHVIGLWTFAPETDASTVSSKSHAVKLQGAAVVPDQRFGWCLESFCGWPVEDKRHAAIAANQPALTPKGAFTLELWIRPKPELTDYPEAFLVDKKHIAHTDYQFTLGAPDKSGTRRLNMRLGFGDSSENYMSESSVYSTGVWTHVAFTYDGAGAGRFYRDGTVLGGADKPERGSLVPGKYPLSIGDRNGSYYHGFPGFISQVRLCDGVLDFRPVTLVYESDRDVFVRMETVPPLRFTLVNKRRDPLPGATVVLLLEAKEVAHVAVPELASGAGFQVDVPFDTSLRPDITVLRARISIPGAAPYVSEETFSVTIVPRRPVRMPVVMWGVYGTERVIQELPRLKAIGFTHCLGFRADYGRIFEAGRPIEPDTPERGADTARMLNTALANDFGVIASLSPGSWAAKAKPAFRRIDKNGKSNDKDPTLCAAFPEMSNFCYNVGASVAQAYSAFPAWQAALLHTELRDDANICFHEHDHAAYRQATGLDYPDDAPRKWGVEYATLKDFPADRVIPDNHPLLTFLSWYWKEGDGWNSLNTALHRGLISAGRDDVWTFHDPAARVASVYGSGGDVSVISQWTYSYPDPIRIGVATDELFAMARGAAHPQAVMKMTQIIWKRAETTQTKANKVNASPWEDADPDAAYPTIAPMHLREAFWTKLARPVQGIMYHGWEALVPVEGTKSSYRYTHPQTQHELARLVRDVIEPLGPTLLQVPDRPADVAYLESFAAQMFARRGTYGWGRSWSGDAYQMLLWAHLQPEIIYDETVRQRGLDRYRILVMMDCDVLTTRVVERVTAFQSKGGIVVGDERLCPAIHADILVPSYTRTRRAHEDRTELVAKAEALRKALEGRYQRYCDATTPDVVPRCRAYGEADYLFAVNDRREFGDYMGQHGLVMENGLPTETVLSLGRKQGKAYDLVAGQAVKTHLQNDRLQIPRAFGPCEGTVLMVVDKAISKVTIDMPASATRGKSITCALAVVADDGKPVSAVVPVRVMILDPAGEEAERSGFYGAKDGQLQLNLDIASNDRTGLWQLRVIELASRQEASAYFRVMQP